MSKRELSIKHSFMQELHGFPSQQSTQLWEKIGFLIEDPIPDGKLKKKLKGKKDLYRLRVGDFRVFYSFGDGWIRLLGIRRRDERTYSDKSDAVTHEAPPVLPDQEEIDLDALETPRKQAWQTNFQVSAQQTTKPLPFAISPEWLRELKIEEKYFPALLLCDSEEALLASQVPDAVLQRVVDNLFPRPLEEVLQQPDFVVQDTADLVRYKEGSLLSFLLRLDPEQEKLVDWALKGPTMLKGGAGTGKSTVALYRVKKLLEHPKRTGQETVLFTTYTRALEAVSEQLLGQILSPEQLKRTKIATCDQLVREIVATSRKVGAIEGSGALLRRLRELRQSFQPSGRTGFERKLRARVLQKIPDTYLLEEFEWIIEGRGLSTPEEYAKASRAGRGLSFGEKQRASVWELYQAFRSTLQKEGVETFGALRAEALSLVKSGAWKQRFDFVLVDEAQDLSPITLALLAELARSPEGIFFASDNKQSIYSKSYQWKSAHPRLQFQGRTAILKNNYRSTAEIDRAAFALLASDEEDLTPSESRFSGPLPVLLTGISAEEEALWTARFIRQMSSHLRMKTNSSAVLVPTQAIGESLAQKLCQEGLPSRFFAGRNLDLNAPEVKVITLHSAKGLEFPIVVLCGLHPGTYPTPEEFAETAEYEEELRAHRRLLYVGMTRAMRGLMLVQTRDCQDPALQRLDRLHFNIQEVSRA